MSRRVIPATLITTVFNERASVEAFLDSILSLNARPAEFVIVDGGSTDGTTEILQSFARAHADDFTTVVIVDRTCTIRYSPSPVAKGRNLAIRQASQSVIACTDGGCILAPSWLEKITRPLLEDPGVDIVGGWFQPIANTFLERCQAAIVALPGESIKVDDFLPSSRSIAFRKSVWQDVGGYPEVTLTAEDTLFDMRARKLGKIIRFVPDAVVRWRLRPSFATFARLIYRYGFGDGFCRIRVMSAARTILKLSIALALILLGIAFSYWISVLLIGYLWILPFLRHPRDAFRLPHILGFPLIVAHKLTAEIAYLAGYIRGRVATKQPRFLRLEGS